MRIEGHWHRCEDGILRPVIEGGVLAADGFWEPALLLVDTGADRTVLSAALYEALHLPAASAASQLIFRVARPESAIARGLALPTPTTRR